MLNVIAKLWASPTTLIGLLLAALGWLVAGARLRLCNNAIEVVGNRLIAPFTSAVTIGHVIHYASKEPDQRIRDHERQHTYQAEVLGALYLPLHVALQLIAFGYSFFDRSRVYRSLNDRVHSPANLLETGPMSSPPRPW